MVASMDVEGRDVASFVKEANEIIKAQVDIPNGYYISWAGDFKNMEEATQKLMLIIPITLLPDTTGRCRMCSSSKIALTSLRLCVVFTVIGLLDMIFETGMRFFILFEFIVSQSAILSINGRAKLTISNKKEDDFG